MFLNREQQKEANPPFRELDINVDGCHDIWKNCFLHDPSGSFGVEVTGGCNPLRNKGKDKFYKSFTSLFFDKKFKHHKCFLMLGHQVGPPTSRQYVH